MKTGRFQFIATIFALVAVVATGCQTKPVAKVATPTDDSNIQAEARGLSPNGNEHSRTITFGLLIGDPGLVKAWSVNISSSRANVRTYSGSSSDLPETIVWDGKDGSGAIAAEGMYTAALTVDYGSARAPSSAVSKAFILDIVPPAGSFSMSPAQFGYTPQGVKGPVYVSISVKPSLALVEDWSMDIYDESGFQVKSLSGTLPGQVRASWEGRTEQGGELIAGARYPAVLTLRDEFGNEGKSEGEFTVAVMPSAQPSAIVARRDGFSPTSTSMKNSLDLLTTYGSKKSVVDWTVAVRSVRLGLIRSYTGKGAFLPEYSRWDGKDNAGETAPDGNYYAILDVEYGKDYRDTSTRSASFSLVTSPPSGSISVLPPIVTLADLGPRKPVSMIVEANAPFAKIGSWTMAVLDPSGSTVALFRGDWPNNTVSWDGVTIGGGALSPGTKYTLAAKVQDEYGNVGELAGSLSTDGLPAPSEPSAIRSIGTGFAPTGDDSFGRMRFGVETGNPGSVTAWSVDMVGSDGAIQRTYAGAGSKVPSAVAWDGRKADGTLAPEGRYRAQLHIAYGLAFSPAFEESDQFVLDLTPPSVSIDLSTDLFSPGGEGGSPAVTISLDGKSEMAKMAGWTIDILDPVDSSFIRFKGNWAARSVAWTGKGANGDLVESASDYTVVARARDEYGNIGESRKNLPIDILVIKEKDGYRIRISSIVFKGFTADYKDVPPDRARRNQATLDLLAKKLALFPDYNIRLQGYAVMINWNDKAAGDIEQREVLVPLSASRAEAIKSALSDRGVETLRLTTAGNGALDPIVSNGDFQNRWKNRRVEFFLKK